MKAANDGKGKAKRYTVIPINVLRKLWQINIAEKSLVKRINQGIVEKCVTLFDNMNLVEQKVNDLIIDINKLGEFIGTSQIEEVKDLQSNYDLYQAKVKRNLSENLILARSGSEC